MLAAPLTADAQTTAPAKDDQARAKELFLQGETDYRLGKFKEALERFRAAARLTTRASIVLNIAQCYRQLKQTNQALFFYKLYLTQWDRERPGTPSPYTGEVSRHIADLQVLAARSSRSTLVLTSRPTSARIWLDGRELAMTTPATLKDLSPGARSVVLRKDALLYRGSVDLRPGQQTELVAVLEEIRAEVHVISDPPGAEVTVQGRPAGPTPLTLKLPLGQVTLELHKAGRVTARRLVKVDGPHRMEVKVSMLKMARTVVTTTPPGATIFLDGKGVGVSPAVLPVEPGRHRLRLVMAGRTPEERNVELAPGQEALINAELKLSQKLQDRKKRRTTMRALGWTGISLGIAGAFGGAALTIYGHVRSDEAHEAYQKASVQSLMDDAMDRQATGLTYRTWGIVTASVSVALIIAGSVAVGLAPEAVPADITVGAAPTRGGGVLGVGGSF